MLAKYEEFNQNIDLIFDYICFNIQYEKYLENLEYNRYYEQMVDNEIEREYLIH